MQRVEPQLQQDLLCFAVDRGRVVLPLLLGLRDFHLEGVQSLPERVIHNEFLFVLFTDFLLI